MRRRDFVTKTARRRRSSSAAGASGSRRRAPCRAARSTPEAALDQLRRVLARRSYAGLLRVLTPRTRAMIEQDLRSLVDGLDKPDTLAVHVAGDSATVIVPGGHHVRLRRDGGVWRVDDFD